MPCAAGGWTRHRHLGQGWRHPQTWTCLPHCPATPLRYLLKDSGVDLRRTCTRNSRQLRGHSPNWTEPKSPSSWKRRGKLWSSTSAGTAANKKTRFTHTWPDGFTHSCFHLFQSVRKGDAREAFRAEEVPEQNPVRRYYVQVNTSGTPEHPAAPRPPSCRRPCPQQPLCPVRVCGCASPISQVRWATVPYT